MFGLVHKEPMLCFSQTTMHVSVLCEHDKIAIGGVMFCFVPLTQL